MSPCLRELATSVLEGREVGSPAAEAEAAGLLLSSPMQPGTSAALASGDTWPPAPGLGGRRPCNITSSMPQLIAAASDHQRTWQPSCGGSAPHGRWCGATWGQGAPGPGIDSSHADQPAAGWNSGAGSRVSSQSSSVASPGRTRTQTQVGCSAPTLTPSALAEHVDPVRSLCCLVLSGCACE